MQLDGYVRVSRVAGRNGESFISPAVQRERIEAYARSQGHDVARWHEDLDQPGSKADRPGLQAALNRIERGETAGIIVAKADRFARSLTDALAAIRRITDAGGQFVSVGDNFDTATPAGKLALTIFLAFAEFELDRIRETWATAQERAVARGIHVASKAPTGYQRREDGRLEIAQPAADAIRELFRRRARGDGWTALADYLSASGTRTPYGNAVWTPGAVQKVIRNRAYLGEARSGAYVNTDAHEPIVTRAEWEAAQGARIGASVRNGDGLLLAGLVRCAGCRYIVKNDTMRDRDDSRLGLYRCRGRHAAGVCPEPCSMLARVLDPYVERLFLEAIGPDGPLARAFARTDEADVASAAVEEAERELAAYVEADLVSVVGATAFRVGAEARRKALDEARSRLAESHARTTDLPPSGSLLESWPGLRIAERRRFIAAAVDAIVIGPGRVEGRNRSARERVSIVWRGEAPADLPGRGRRVELASWAG